MIRDKDINKIILLTVLSLLVIGIGMTYSASYIVALKRFQDGYLFLKKQILFVSLGIGIVLIVMKIPYTIYRKIGLPLLLLSLISLGLIFVPGWGVSAGKSIRWLRLGSFTFQPSEFAKLAMVIYLASFFSKKGERIKEFVHGFLPPIIVGSIMIILLYMEPDFGAAFSLGAIILIMMFVAGVKFRYLALLSIISLPVLYFMMTNAGYRLDRWLTFLDPGKDPHNTSFQINQSFIAFGSGGLWGVGLGDGRQKLFFLPEAHTDFILSVIGEELGLIGVSIIILLYLIFILSGMAISVRASGTFGALLAFGITLLIALQTVINMGVVTSLLPTKGLPLPFVSYGGTSLLANMTGVGILLSVSLTGKRG